MFLKKDKLILDKIRIMIYNCSINKKQEIKDDSKFDEQNVFLRANALA